MTQTQATLKNTAEPAFSYDELPYEVGAHPATHPAHLRTCARFLGLEAPPVETARILEIGCGDGGNLLPIAARYPQSICVGFDLSARQIEMGQAEAARHGLKNVALKHLSVTDATTELGTFDYIIAHGIFSWVPQEVRPHILRVCKGNLAPNGIALVSYNTLPGWNALRSLREAALFHTARFSSPQEKVAQTVTFLKFIRDSLVGEPDALWRQTIEAELKKLEHQREAYIFHEFLESENNAFYLTQFNKLATEAGLKYMGDAYLENMSIGNLPPTSAKVLAEISDAITQEQYLDFIVNRRFRHTLLCHTENKDAFRVQKDKLFDFYLTSDNLAPDGPFNLQDLSAPIPSFGKGYITPRDRETAAILLSLHEQGTRPLATSDLLKKAAAKLGLENEEILRPLMMEIGFHLVFAGRIQLHDAPYGDVDELSERPKVWEHARMQAASNAPMTNVRHRTERFEPVAYLFISLLDGTRTITEAQKAFEKSMEERGAQFTLSDGTVVTDSATRKKLFDDFTQNTLTNLLRHHFLVD